MSTHVSSSSRRLINGLHPAQISSLLTDTGVNHDTNHFPVRPGGGETRDRASPCGMSDNDSVTPDLLSFIMVKIPDGSGNPDSQMRHKYCVTKTLSTATPNENVC